MKKLLEDILTRDIMQKMIFSGSRNPEIVRCTAKPFSAKGENFIQFETFTVDNKATHTNIPYDACAEYALGLAVSFRNVNIFTTAGNCEILVSKKGKMTVIGKLKSDAESVTVKEHNKQKKHILPDGVPCPFLERLGVCDSDGHIFDKKRSKYRQINKFLEIVRDVKSSLSNEPYILDLCCGKSYLSFALYWYLRDVCNLKPELVGIDLKKDVIDYCNEVSSDVGFDGLQFESGDIIEYEISKQPDLVVSLHACDIATDIVLAKAIKSEAKIILSSPCCHHEMMHQLDEKNGIIGIIDEYSMLKQKFCDSATDALRSKLLEAYGYSVDVIEFIDPDETPKNLLIRAVKKHGKNDKALEDYKSACREIGVKPKLAELLDIEI